MKSNDQKSESSAAPESTGGSWQFRLVIIVIVLGVFGLIAKTMGLF